MPDAKFPQLPMKNTQAGLKSAIARGDSKHAALAKAQPLVSKVKV